MLLLSHFIVLSFNARDKDTHEIVYSSQRVNWITILEACLSALECVYFG